MYDSIIASNNILTHANTTGSEVGLKTEKGDQHRNDPKLQQAAEEFEAAFISQMLKFSGLGEALTKGGGEDVAAFTDFYIQNYADKIVDKGGFGLADKFYDKLASRAGGAFESVLDVRS